MHQHCKCILFAIAVMMIFKKRCNTELYKSSFNLKLIILEWLNLSPHTAGLVKFVIKPDHWGISCALSHFHDLHSPRVKHQHSSENNNNKKNASSLPVGIYCLAADSAKPAPSRKSWPDNSCRIRWESRSLLAVMDATVIKQRLVRRSNAAGAGETPISPTDFTRSRAGARWGFDREIGGKSIWSGWNTEPEAAGACSVPQSLTSSEVLGWSVGEVLQRTQKRCPCLPTCAACG